MKRFLILLSIFCFMFGCKKEADVSGKPVVTVSILPIKQFVDVIGGGSFDVNVIIPVGSDPHSYEPSPAQMVALSKSKSNFTIGLLPIEQKLEEKWHSLNPNMKIVNLSKDLSLLEESVCHHHHHDGHEHHDHDGVEHEEDEHHHEDAEHAHSVEEHHEEAEEHDHHEHAHEHSGKDPHIWLSPYNVLKMVDVIYSELVLLMPEKEAEFKANLDAYKAEIEAVAEEIKSAFSEKKSSKILVYHPAWGYFCRDFGLEQVAIEVDGKEASSKTIKALIDQANKDSIKVIFHQKQFSPTNAKVIATNIGGNVIMIDDLAEDWIGNMRDMAGKVGGALK